jgi:putative transposase
VAQACIAENIRTNLVLKICQISRSSYYYKPALGAKKVGKPASAFTKKLTGGYDNDSVVIEEIIKLLAMPFVDYGYLKTTFYLRDEKNYLINPKKVYRLMAENGLLCDNKGIREHSPRQWVKELVPNPIAAFTYFEFDIKYIYIQGKRKNAQVLTVLDVFSRWNMGHLIKWDMKQNDVIKLFNQIFEKYDLPNQFYVRNDNGSQFIADSVQLYFKGKNVTQEFTKPATPEQNAHIESYHSIMERVICKRYEFDDLKNAVETMNQFQEFYNFNRIHSGVKYKSPYKFLLKQGIDMKNQNLKSTQILNFKTENSVQELGG